MASPALVSSKTLCQSPFFIQELQVTTGATAGDVAHGCPREPDVVVVQSFGAIDNSNEVTVVSKDSDTINLDCEDDGNNTVRVYCICFDQASGGYSDSAIPLTTP